MEQFFKERQAKLLIGLSNVIILCSVEFDLPETQNRTRSFKTSSTRRCGRSAAFRATANTSARDLPDNTHSTFGKNRWATWSKFCTERKEKFCSMLWWENFKGIFFIESFACDCSWDFLDLPNLPSAWIMRDDVQGLVLVSTISGAAHHSSSGTKSHPLLSDGLAFNCPQPFWFFCFPLLYC